MKNQKKYNKIVSFRLTLDEYEKLAEHIDQFEEKTFSKKLRSYFRENGVI